MTQRLNERVLGRRLAQELKDQELTRVSGGLDPGPQTFVLDPENQDDATLRGDIPGIGAGSSDVG